MLALLPFPSPVYVRIATGLLMARWSQQVTHHCLRLRMVEGEPGVGGAVGRALAEEYVPGLREELELQEGVAPGGWRRVRLEPEWTVGYAVQVALQRAAGWWVGGFVRYWSAGLGKVTGWGGSAGVVVVLIVVRALVNEYLEGWGLAGALVVVWWFLVRVEAGARGMYGARRLGGGLARLAGVFLVTLVVFVVVFGGLVAVLGLWLQAGGLLS